MAPAEKPPFPVEAWGSEEDTYLVLSAPVGSASRADHPIRLMTALWNVEPEEPGSVVVKHGDPLRFLAVVHDLNQDPTCRPEWVVSALQGIRLQVESRKLESLALPLVGCVHGRIPTGLFAEMLSAWFQEEPRVPLERLWIVAEPDQGQVVLEELAKSSP